MNRYLSLIMGEIPRLLDNKEGYGPNGRGFIVHVEISKNVLKSYERLKIDYNNFIRK
ncbi:hypothetical protein UT300003_25120 [Clostridium sardiniense]